MGSKKTLMSHWVISWSIFILGLMIMGFGIALMIQAELGCSPWDVLHIGLFKHFGLTVGTWSIFVGVFIVFITCVLTRTWPSAGTVVNMLLLGVFIDIFLAIFNTPATIYGKWFMLIVGIIINGAGIAFYIAADKGAGPRDTLMLYLTQITKWKIATIRRILEVGVLICGWWMGGPVFYGTVFYAVTIGTIVGWLLPLFQRWTKKWISGKPIDIKAQEKALP
ncbi:MAG: YczE/YyaS/YitT family protein [Tuberibacillus sp.]